MLSKLALLSYLPVVVLGLVCVAGAKESRADEMIVAENGKASATIVVVAENAGPYEKQAATDLIEYVKRMTGAELGLANDAVKIAAALSGSTPTIVLGEQALQVEPSLKTMLAKVAKPNPTIRADAIALRRSGNRTCLAGTNDQSHYYAMVELLHRWGCRWYMPGEIGACIPTARRLVITSEDFAYGCPFEVRRYWIAWNGIHDGKPEFMMLNRMNDELVPNGHHLATYTKELIPPGKTMFNVPIAEDSTAQHVAKKILSDYAAGKDIMLGMEDGLYQSDSPIDKELIALQYDKYFLTQSYTDAFMTFYNKVADILMKEVPNSKSRIGFLAYANITLPPVKVKDARAPLVAYLAPIDIDPIHGIGDSRSGPKMEYKDIVDGWAKVMQGRVVIYDYDQSMLVWRDMPNPSISATRRDIPYYAQAGILGVDTESRGALATTWINQYVRARLLWDPTADVDQLLAEFYEKFYGPAAKPMAEYWTAILDAWENTIVTEHEYFVAPAIYTPQLLAKMQSSLQAAETAIGPHKSNAAMKLFVDRLVLTRESFEITSNYMAMVRAANTECDYAAAVAAGERALAVREAMTTRDGRFATYKIIGEHGYAWFPGEVKQYQELLPLVDGSKGTLIAKLPLVWNFRRDPKDVGAKENWAAQPVDLAWWNSQAEPQSVASRQENPGNWEQVRSDVYLQAQGVITPDFQSYTGHGWYQTDVELTADQVAGNVHLRFPGLFNECWLYVNGTEVAHREFKGVWWLNDYRFEWDVELAGKLKSGQNSIVVRINNPHHFGGMFRRPFVYRAVP